MIKSLAIAALAAFSTLAGVRAATAHTVLVLHAKPGDTAEVVLNGTKVGSAPVDADGQARVPVDLAKAGKTEMDANVFVDTCDRIHRVQLVDHGQTPPVADSGCSRRDIPGVYWVRGVNTIVVDVTSELTPTLLLVKGNYTPPAVTPENPEGTPTEHRPAPTGLALFGGAGLTSFSNASTNICGDASTCDTKGKLGFIAGGEFWATKYLGGSVAYMRPANLTTTGSGTNLSFTSTQKLDDIIMVARAAAPVGPVRIFGEGGMNRVQGVLNASETVSAATVTNLAGDTVTTPGGTQTFTLKTDGWGWVTGGGVEGWFNPHVGIFGEVLYQKIKGKATAEGIAPLDDKLVSAWVGMTFHVGPKQSQ